MLMKKKLDNSDLEANLLEAISKELKAKNQEASDSIRHKRLKFSRVRIISLVNKIHLELAQHRRNNREENEQEKFKYSRSQYQDA